jgi:serine carboxypeptidase-like clade 1
MVTIFQVANVIFLDAPVGTGFSYSKSPEGYYSSDTKSPYAIYLFLRKVSKNSEIKWL